MPAGDDRATLTNSHSFADARSRPDWTSVRDGAPSEPASRPPNDRTSQRRTAATGSGQPYLPCLALPPPRLMSRPETHHRQHLNQHARSTDAFGHTHHSCRPNMSALEINRRQMWLGSVSVPFCVRSARLFTRNTLLGRRIVSSLCSAFADGGSWCWARKMNGSTHHVLTKTFNWPPFGSIWRQQKAVQIGFCRFIHRYCLGRDRYIHTLAN